ncbi:MAG TPA: aminodeoxychorismate/anthranilate synthase component II [Planctomycetota bacterium]|nr:aminodeoxychorismate/anthranilate synthase component II [Planctomycetota bacterium]
MVLLIDNFDSFVYNLARYLEELGRETRVVRTDAITVNGIRALRPSAIVISPGPCDPSRAGISLDVVRELGAEVPILGVCLGHQVIGAAFGGSVIRGKATHGRADEIHHDGRGIFKGIPNPFPGARYHSLVVSEEGLPGTLEVTARLEDGTIMALRHRRLPIVGVQFHPESILTHHGHSLLKNFLDHADSFSFAAPALLAVTTPGAPSPGAS